MASKTRNKRRFQVAELPDLKAEVTEYQRHSRTCPCCGQVNQAPLPEDFPTHSIGPGLAALMPTWLRRARPGKQRRVEGVVETVFEVPVALGTVAKLEQEMSGALEAALSGRPWPPSGSRPPPNVWTRRVGRRRGRKKTPAVGGDGDRRGVPHPSAAQRRRGAAVGGSDVAGAFCAATAGGLTTACAAAAWANCWAHLKRNWEKSATSVAARPNESPTALLGHQRPGL